MIVSDFLFLLAPFLIVILTVFDPVYFSSTGLMVILYFPPARRFVPYPMNPLLFLYVPVTRVIGFFLLGTYM